MAGISAPPSALASALWWFWYVRGRLGEAWRWHKQILHDPRVAAWSAGLAECSVAAGRIAVRLLMREEAQALLLDAERQFHQLGDDAGAACARCGLGYAALQMGGDRVRRWQVCARRWR